MKRVRVSGQAVRDLDDIWLYTAKKSGSIKIADKLIDSITLVFPILASTPKAGASRDNIHPGLRAFPAAGKYLVYYKESGPRMVVVRVLHGMRDQWRAYRQA